MPKKSTKTKAVKVEVRRDLTDLDLTQIAAGDMTLKGMLCTRLKVLYDKEPLTRCYVEGTFSMPSVMIVPEIGSGRHGDLGIQLPPQTFVVGGSRPKAHCVTNPRKFEILDQAFALGCQWAIDEMTRINKGKPVIIQGGR